MVLIMFALLHEWCPWSVVHSLISGSDPYDQYELYLPTLDRSLNIKAYCFFPHDCCGHSQFQIVLDIPNFSFTVNFLKFSLKSLVRSSIWALSWILTRNHRLPFLIQKLFHPSKTLLPTFRVGW